MRTIDIIRRSGRSLRQAKVRTFLTASAIGVGAFALTMTLAASNGAQAYVNKIITNNFDPSELVVTDDPTVLGQTSGNKPQLYSANYTSSNSDIKGISTQVKDLTDADLAKIRALPGVEQVREAVSPSIKYVTGPNNKQYVATAYTFSPAQHPDLVAGKISANLANMQLLLPKAFVSALGFGNAQAAVGQPINIYIQKGFNLAEVQAALQQASSFSQLSDQARANTQAFKFTVAAVYNPPVTAQPGTSSNLFYIGLPDARTLNDFATKNTPSYHKYSYAYVRATGGTNATKLDAVQNKLKSLGYYAMSEKDTQKFLNQIIAVLRGIVIAFGAIALIASVFGIVNTMYISVLQRTREIGLMKALGMRRREIGSLFRVEAAWIGFLGGVLGSLMAVLLGTLINPAISKKLDLGTGQKLLIFEPVQIIVLIVILMLVAIFAGLLPARKASRLDPIEALRVE